MKPRRRGHRWAVVGILACTGVVAVVAGSLVGSGIDASATPRDLEGAAVAFEPGASPPPTSRSRAVDDEGMRLRAASHGLDVALGSLDSVDGEVTPPGFTSAYVVRDRSVAWDDASTGTVVVAMHALSGGSAPGNAFIDPITGETTVGAGDLIDVATRRYTVTQVRRVPKPDLAFDEDLWIPAAGRLIVITCVPREGTAARDNLVVIAQATPTP